MPAETKRKFQTGQPVSTRRRAKKARVAAAMAERNAVTPSKKAQRRAARPPKPERAVESDDEEQEEVEEEEEEVEEEQEQEENYDHDQDQDEDEDEDEDEQEELAQQSRTHEQAESDDEDHSDNEPIGKGKKGYKKKVKKPSGKKGKVFVDTNAMLSIIDQVAGKEEARTQMKHAQMGKIKSKMSAKEQKQADKEKARKELINKKIQEIKNKKTVKRKENKQRAALEEAKEAASAGKRSVSFQL